ncbi:MAG TPA: nitrate reductase cytochrome c-type subunit [Burkholderiales bacterium]|nr:nitrate reductase cytochrome c-type subunit [Burkholderiales bacterium]
MNKACLRIVLLACGLLATAAAAQQSGLVDAMRGRTPLAEETRPPVLPNVENKDLRRERAYTMQPPTIPHKIDGYQLDKNANRCLFCHNRDRIPETQAIPLSVTHYMDRDGNVRAAISPRRYFCTQCHVTQTETKPLVDNTFQDVDAVLKRTGGAQTKAERTPAR